jgi:hypothetical protein
MDVDVDVDARKGRMMGMEMKMGMEMEMEMEQGASRVGRWVSNGYQRIASTQHQWPILTRNARPRARATKG